MVDTRGPPCLSRNHHGITVWIRVMGLRLHLKWGGGSGVIGDQCGGLVEADESSADLGSLRLCVTGLAKLPSTILLRWGSWSFSLPIWVEVRASCALAPVTEEVVWLGLKGRDLLGGVSEFAKLMGSLGVLPDQQVGRSEAQRTDAVSLGQKRWAPVHHLPQVGQAGGHVLFNDPGCGLGLVVKDPALPNPGQSNPNLSRVCASQRDGLELRRTLSAMEPSPESGQPQAKITVEDFGGSSLLIGSTIGASPTHPAQWFVFPFVMVWSFVGPILSWQCPRNLDDLRRRQLWRISEIVHTRLGLVLGFLKRFSALVAGEHYFCGCVLGEGSRD
ncbi:hypothetical protein LOK49_LG03G01117 [Camellia lanceoleosa]|uniref:Uncharacterized protein n=1 Tax=Camellia lanceoleosa TaxID=1840588 RepID=A0ACC0IBY1_9ERIC|nr:hypothetical protein LOK49_LG03G01117 [Camellia lanceoleosa]